MDDASIKMEITKTNPAMEESIHDLMEYLQKKVGAPGEAINLLTNVVIRIFLECHEEGQKGYSDYIDQLQQVKNQLGPQKENVH